MSKVSPGKKQHRTMRGKILDMDILRKRNELTPAVGNAKVNARGDEIGAGGKIVRKREDIVKEHYRNAGSAQVDASVTARAPREAKQPVSNTAVEEAPTVEETVEVKKTTRTKKQESTKQEPTKIEEKLTQAEKELLEEDDWTEDENGNFVKKGK